MFEAGAKGYILKTILASVARYLRVRRSSGEKVHTSIHHSPLIANFA